LIVPDRKTESYLNEPATPKAVARLCRAGVIAPTAFLQAAALCRIDGGWEKGVIAFLRLSTALFFAAVLFFLTLAHWDFLYQTGGFAAAAVLFGGCACLRRRHAAADYAGIGLIILMYFLPDTVFMSGASARANLLACAILSGVWAVPSGRAGVRLSPFVLLNAAFCLSCDGVLFLFAAALNAAILIAREVFREHSFDTRFSVRRGDRKQQCFPVSSLPDRFRGGGILLHRPPARCRIAAHSCRI